MEELGNYEIHISMRQIKRWLIVGIIGFMCFMAGIAYGLLTGFHFISSKDLLDTIFGALMVIGVILMTTAIMKLHPAPVKTSEKGPEI